MSSGLEERLKKALAGRSPAEMNEFQFLNLEMVKVETGDRWIDVRKKIYSVAAHFVEKRVHPDDVVVRCRGGFILIFAHLSAEESRARLEALSQELNVFFLGDQILKNLDINACARKVNAAEFAQFIQMSAQADPAEAAAGGRRRAAKAPDDAPGKDAKWAQGDKREKSGGLREMPLRPHRNPACRRKLETRPRRPGDGRNGRLQNRLSRHTPVVWRSAERAPGAIRGSRARRIVKRPM